jgi:hypothetical protein
MFRESRLLSNQLFKVSNTILIFSSKPLKLKWLNKILVSSANNRGMDVTALGKSYIYMRKSKGPRMEPCGMSCLTLSQLFIFLFYIDNLNMYHAGWIYKMHYRYELFHNIPVKTKEYHDLHYWKPSLSYKM